MVMWHDFDAPLGSLDGTPAPSSPRTQRTSQVKKYVGLMADPVFGFQANPGVSWNRNPAPQGVNPHEWAAQQDKYFAAKLRQETYNQAYKKAFDGEMHLGNVWALMPFKGGWTADVKKHRYEFGEDGRGIVGYTEKEHRESPHMTQEFYHDLVLGAVKQAQQDRSEYDKNLGLERDRWDEDDRSKTQLEGIRREYARITAETQRKAKEQAQYIQSYNAASQARQARMANNPQQRFAADAARGRASADESSGASLLSYKGLDNEQKLGGKGKLGGKTLLGA